MFAADKRLIKRQGRAYKCNVVITPSCLGAASGIGSASCFKLASEGAKVVLVDRVQKNLKSSFETLSRTHDNDHLQICGDVSQADFGKQVFDSVHVSL